ncbi:hypothetical protein I3842_07G075800 [Carya illinoinensis]|uniref:Uncharacterized protein n=1 Tax=Carya illinoinensis TaxID=32201 RepID=A0A922EHA7_CARIL|nr:hypothetical protein I3842_07G075800 [Carya illinoinensis]
MEDRSEEWKLIEFSSEAIGAKVSGMLNKGLLLGKKILIAGILVSSTPLVLPPLLAISAIGLAVSVPSGLILASYACSEKLMRKLFPGTAAPPLLLDFGLVSNDEEICRDEEEEEGAVGFGGEVDKVEGEEDRMEETERMGEMSVELVEKEIEDNTEGKATAGVEYGQGRAKKDKKEFVEDADTVGEKGYEEDVGEYEDEEEEKPLEEKIEVKNGLKEEKEEPEIEGKTDEQLLLEGHGLVVVIEGDEGSGNKVGKVETPFQGTTAALEELGCPEKASGIEEEELLRETRVLIERLRDERTEERQGGAEEGGDDDKDQDFPLNRVLDIVISLNTDEREIADESGLDLFDVKTVVLPKESSTNMGREAAESAERFVAATVHASSLPSEKDIIVPSSEVLSNEEEIWEKIDAMRTIVGYKATPQRTCMEELKALYIFTGVELPASPSFMDPSDLGKVYESLQFLMSIVGVK